MNNIIRIKKASFYGYHGVLSEEQSVGGKFEADVDIYTDFSEATKKDSLKQTIDYNAVYKFLYKMALEHKYFEKIQKVNVRVRKNNPPLGGVVDCVEVEVEKSRSELS